MQHLRTVIFITYIIIVLVPYVCAYVFTALANKVFELLEPRN